MTSIGRRFEKSELGRMKKLLPLHAMAENFGLARKSMRTKLGRKSYVRPIVRGQGEWDTDLVLEARTAVQPG